MVCSGVVIISLASWSFGAVTWKADAVDALTELARHEHVLDRGITLGDALSCGLAELVSDPHTTRCRV